MTENDTMTNDTIENDIERLKQLNEGDELLVRGERFRVSHQIDGGLVLTPHDENGHGQLDWEKLEGRLIYTRKRGIDTHDVDIREDSPN